jgi:Family of unknown function (DUF6232)
VRVRHKTVEARITGRMLWVEDHAYPIQHITSVRPREFRPRRQRMIWTFLRRVAALAGLGVVGLIGLGCLGDTLPAYASTVFAVLVLGVVGFHTIRLIRLLRMPSVYVLSIATAGATTAVVASTNAQQIRDLAQHVVVAIDNPAMDYVIHVDHIDIVHGDKIEGDKIMGDFVEHDKIVL